MSSEPDNPTAHRLAQWDKQYVWHPFTPMAQWIAGEQIVIERGEGFELIDTLGRRWIDGFGSLWCNLHGHAVPQIDQAVREQLDKVAHSTLLGFGSVASIELARRLVEIMPPAMRGLKKVFYSDSGATAVEVALKMAYQFYQNRGQSQRRRFVAFRDGYHGDTIGSVSLGGVDAFHQLFRPLLFEATFVDSPNPYHHPLGQRGGQAVLAQLDEVLSANPGEYCGVFIEPLMQGAGGMLTQPPGFLRALRELTRRHDVLLICDEVATGFCRTGKLFACEHEDVCPDLLCLGKGLTGGYIPVAATMATQEIFDAFLGEAGQERTFYHGHTFTGNALGCAAACASIGLIFESHLPEALPAKVKLMAEYLAKLAEHPHVGDIRQCGMMAGIELVQSRPRTFFDKTQHIGRAVCDYAARFGLIVRPLDDIIVLMPAPAMDLPTLERMMNAIVRSVEEFFE